VTVVDFRPDGRLLASICGKHVRFWEMPTGKRMGEISRETRCLAFSPDGRDFGALDNLTLGYRGTWRLTEAEIEFEAIEPG
jgi:hypothetical protein